MAPRRKPPVKGEPVDISQRLADSLAKKSEPQVHQSHEAPQVGEIVRMKGRDTEYQVTSVSSDGLEVNLHLPGTNIERYRVRVDDLNISGRAARQPKERPKPRIDVDAVRERMERSERSIFDHIHAELAGLKKWLRSKGVSATEPLDEFSNQAEAIWKTATEATEEKLEE